MNHYTLATLGANVENTFSDLEDLRPGDSFPETEEYTMIDTLKYENAQGHSTIKAIAYKNNSTGEIFFHFNGTGDANWDENAVNYGTEPNPSDLQKSCLNFTDRILGLPQYSDASVYVTGHSQGGNNAQFVTMRSQHGTRIETCVSLDGPGFSSKFVANTKNMYGEDYFNSQRNKIYAYNGESDYVSCLGQEQIIPDDHTTFIKTPKSAEDSSSFMMQYHLAKYLVDENGNLNARGDKTEFRKLIESVNERVLQLPPEQQARAALLTMKLIEWTSGDVKPVMTPEELEEFKELLIPILVDALSYDPQKMSDVLTQLGFDATTTTLIMTLVGSFNKLPERDREQLFAAIAQCIVITPENSYGFDLAPLLGEPIANFIENLSENPEKMLDNPFVLAAVVILSPYIISAALDLVAATALLAALALAVPYIAEAYKNIKDFVVDCLTAINEWFEKVKQWWRETFEKGVAYARSNPYFKVDTGKLYEYAGRVDAVMNRIKSLDRDLNDLYWQVGFLDLLDVLDVLGANLMVGGTGKLKKVKNYLTNTADRFVLAENETTNIFSGG